MMKRFGILMLVLVLCAGLALAENMTDAEPASWAIPETNEMTEEVTAIFNNAMQELVGVDYEPLAFLGEKDGVYCVFCRATVVYPNAVPYYTLVYVTESGIQNIWEIWMDKHAEAAEIPEEPESAETEPVEESFGDIQYVMYLGTNDKDTNLPVFTPDEAIEQAKAILIRHFGGYTIQEAHGGWVDGDMEYQEYTLVIYLSDTTLDQVHAAADDMIDVFHQSSVLIQENPTRTDFYSGNN